MIRKYVLLLVLLLSFGLGVISINAQGIINDNQPIVLNVDTNNPQPNFGFTATAGDQITIIAMSLTPDFNPTLSLAGPTGLLDTQSSDPFSLQTNIITITRRILQDGNYTVTLQAPPNGVGQVALTLSRRAPQNATELVRGQNIAAQLNAQTSNLFFFYTDPDNPTNLCITADDPRFDFVAHIYNENGTHINTIGEDLPRAAYRIRPLIVESPQHFYEVELIASHPDTTGIVNIGLDTCTCTANIDTGTSPQPTPGDGGNPVPTTVATFEPTATSETPGETATASPTATATTSGETPVASPTVTATTPGETPLPSPTATMPITEVPTEVTADETPLTVVPSPTLPPPTPTQPSRITPTPNGTITVPLTPGGGPNLTLVPVTAEFWTPTPFPTLIVPTLESGVPSTPLGPGTGD